MEYRQLLPPLQLEKEPRTPKVHHHHWPTEKPRVPSAVTDVLNFIMEFSHAMVSLILINLLNLVMIASTDFTL